MEAISFGSPHHSALESLRYAERFIVSKRAKASVHLVISAACS
jgi:hypothetical protein